MATYSSSLQAETYNRAYWLVRVVREKQFNTIISFSTVLIQIHKTKTKLNFAHAEILVVNYKKH